MWMWACGWLCIACDAEVADQAKAVLAVLCAHLHGDARHLRHDVARPQLVLVQVLARHREQHHVGPVEPVVEDDDVVILVLDERRLAPATISQNTQ